MSWVCTLCEKYFSEIPPDATPIGRKSHGLQLWRIGDLVHDLKLNRPKIPNHNAHTITPTEVESPGKSAGDSRVKAKSPEVPVTNASHIHHVKLGIKKFGCIFCEDASKPAEPVTLPTAPVEQTELLCGGKKPHSDKTTYQELASVVIKHHLLMRKQTIRIGDKVVVIHLSTV